MYTEALRPVYDLIKGCKLFDRKYYAKDNPGFKRVMNDPIEHYIKFGAKEMKNPSVLFDTLFYLQHNRDINPDNINPLYHFIKYGQLEKRQFIPESRSLDVLRGKTNCINPIQIFNKLKASYYIICSGFYDYDFYLSSSEAYQHSIFRKFFCGFRNSPVKLFSYLGKLLTHPVLHYVFIGVYQGKDLTANFNSAYYLSHNWDVLFSGFN
ncbi:MAG: hypothetical protein R6T92_05630, partial [Desulfosalsimonadaceae bacterium]